MHDSGQSRRWLMLVLIADIGTRAANLKREDTVCMEIAQLIIDI